MNEYEYKVKLCDGNYCDGSIKVIADNEEKAYEMVMDYVLENLVKALPELGIEVAIENV